ncbi:MAG: radical SAM protein [Candidatus Natronoplasma sp.]
MTEESLSELDNCELCEWRCGVNRLEGESGVCMLGELKVASTTLHPAPPQSYTVFMAGCNFRCLNCQNWEIAHFPEQDNTVRGYVEPEKLAEEAVSKIRSTRGRMIGADRVFFSGGSPTPSLPYVERVVEEAKKLDPEIKVNYDTNGFLTPNSLNRVIEIADSITFDIKAFQDDIHRRLTGAPVRPVLRNAKELAEEAKEKLWEFRYLLIPGINDQDVEPLARFLSQIDEKLPINFLAFRPNFVMEDCRGAEEEEMIEAVKMAKRAGLEDVSWSGRTGVRGKVSSKKGGETGASKARYIAEKNGCVERPRDCGSCQNMFSCPIKDHRAGRKT